MGPKLTGKYFLGYDHLHAESVNLAPLYTDAPGYPNQGILSLWPTLRITDDITQYFICSAIVPRLNIAAGKTNSGYLIAHKVQAIRNEVDDCGALVNLYGYYMQYGHGSDAQSSIETTNLYGVYLKPYSEIGTITNLYGMFIDIPTVGGTVTSEWGVYVANTADNYFAGKVGIGFNTPSTKLHVADADAYLTLRNTTAENSEGGAETKVIFEDHSGTALAQIQGSHAGTSDDTKGDLIFSTHNGSALTERLRLDDAGNVKIGGDSVIISDASGNLTSANGVANFSGAIANLTVVNGIVTAAS